MKKKKPFILRTATIAFFILCYGTLVYSQSYTVKMSLNQNDTFRYKIKMNMLMSIQGMDMNMEMETGCLFKVISAKPDAKKLQMTYTKMNYALTGGPMSKMPDSISKKLSQAFIGKSVILKLSDDNQVTEIIGLDSLVINSAQTPMAQQMMKQLFSKEQMNNLFGIMFSMYPKKPVKIGDSWNTSPTINMSGLNMGINFTYTLAEIKNNIAIINLDGIIDCKGEMKTPSINIPVTMKGTEKGNIEISLVDGYMHSAAYKMDIDAIMEAMGQKTPMKMTGDYTLTGN